jgi:hypothetical protein
MSATKRPLPPAAYRDWLRKQRNQARGEAKMWQGVAQMYAEHNAKLASAPPCHPAPKAQRV